MPIPTDRVTPINKTGVPHLLSGFLLWLLALFLPLSVQAASVVGITDGDTLTVLEGNKTLIIRLANIDAPEKKQPYYQQSRQSLSDLCFGKNADYEVLDTDPNKRAIAIVYCGGVNVNRAQVERGMAWVYDHFNHDPELPALQEQARAKRIGLWKSQVAIPPWEFRRKGRIIQQFPKRDNTGTR